MSVSSSSPTTTSPTTFTEYPTWSDVQAAKKNKQTAQAEVTRLKGILSKLLSTSDKANQNFIAATAAYTTAKQNLAATNQQLTSLQKEEAASNAKLTALRQKSGVVVSQMARGGNPTLSLLFSGDTSNLLSKLGTLNEIGTQNQYTLAQVKSAKNILDSIESQVQIEQTAQVQQQTDMLAKQTAAKAAQKTAATALKTAKAKQSELVAQLKLLNVVYSLTNAYYLESQGASAAAAAAGDGNASTLKDITGTGDSLAPLAAQKYAYSIFPKFGWSGLDQQACLISLWNQESGWRWNAYNPSSGSYGIPQALPGSKMGTAGSDWATSAKTQIKWGLGYIQNRYGSPCAAYKFENSHSPAWY